MSGEVTQNVIMLMIMCYKLTLVGTENLEQEWDVPLFRLSSVEWSCKVLGSSQQLLLIVEVC